MEDLRLTKRCRAALALVNVKLHDHLIICGQEYFSFAEQGYMNAINQNEQTDDKKVQKAAETSLGVFLPEQF